MIGLTLDIWRPVYSGAGTSLPTAPLSQMLYVSEGDSITAGGTGGSVSYSRRYFNDNVPRVVFRNASLGGRDMAGVIANAATVDAFLTTYLFCQNNILSVLVTANDFANNVNTILTNLASYCDARRAAGWKVAVGTGIPRGPGGSGSAATETWRATFNATVRTWVGVHCDAIMDFAADPIMGDYAQTTNATYFIDQIHPTDIGQIRLKDIAKYALSGLTALQTDAQFSPWGATAKHADLALSAANYTLGNNASPGSWRTGHMAIGRDTGKWYTEFLIGGTNDLMFGVANVINPYATWLNGVGYATDGAGNGFSCIGLWPASNGNFNGGVTQVNAPTITSYVAGDRCGLFVDFDAGKIWFARNNTFVASGNPATGANPNFTFTPNRLLFPGASFNPAIGSVTLPANSGALAYPLLTGWSAF